MALTKRSRSIAEATQPPWASMVEREPLYGHGTCSLTLGSTDSLNPAPGKS